jgi:hypothetical protein
MSVAFMNSSSEMGWEVGDVCPERGSSVTIRTTSRNPKARAIFMVVRAIPSGVGSLTT